MGRVPEPGETAVCPGCGQDVPLKPCRRVPDPGVDLVNGGPTFALHYTPDTETTRSTVCMAYLTARPEESR